MTTKPFILTLTTLTFATLTNLATAAPNNERFPIDIAAAEARQTERFEKLDQNDDNIVSLAEFEQAPFDPAMQHRRQRGEHTGPRSGKRRAAHAHPQRKAMRDAAAAELFKILDSNNDGSLSEAEFAANNRAQMKLSRKRAAFARFDQDQNGHLERNEMASHLAHLKAADRDGDGLVTRRELREARRSHRQASDAG